MNLDRRLDRLESRAAPTAACGVCGSTPGAARTFTVEFEDGPNAPRPEDVCAGCGRRHTFRIEFDDRG